MATYTIRNNTTQDWRDTAMSKAQFEALASERRANRAGSGFDEWGKHTNNWYNVFNINEGMKVWSGGANWLYLSDDNDTLGVSKTKYPLININGVTHTLKYVGAHDSNIITIPTAPTIYPHDATLTQQQIDSGVIKHADASNSGLITNGKFDTNTSGWAASNSTLSVVSGAMRITNTIASVGYASQGFSTVIGKKYVAEFNRVLAPLFLYIKDATNTTILISDTTATTGRISLEFVATTTTTNIIAYCQSGSAGAYCDIDNIAVFPADAISRSDLVFLESWHEDVSEKDFVYPLGNVQYLGTTGDCGTPIAGAFSGSGTYSLFGNWQASETLIGKGYVWSTLSDANKKAFVANPENNCYLDGDKVIQVRYRARVVAGMGDSWKNLAVDNSSVTSIGYNTSSFISTKGKSVSVITDLTSSPSIYYNPPSNITNINKVLGQWEAYNATSVAYEGKCFALPIALVHRRNQGAYHPVYNPNGANKLTDVGNTGGRFWYDSSAIQGTTLSQMFTKYNVGGVLSSSERGSIASAQPGRPDGLFYDQVHESDILDLRMSSQKVEDYNRLIDREFNKLVAGTYRGTEGEWVILDTFTTTTTNDNYYSDSTPYTGTYIDTGAHTYFTRYGTISSQVFKGDISLIALVNGVPFKVSALESNTRAYIQKELGTKTNFTSSINNGDTVIFVLATKSTRTKSNNIIHTDIIGSPANYPTAWKQSGVSGTPLLVGEDGISMLPTGALTTFKLSRKANATPLQVLKSTDSGATWTPLTVTTHYTFSTVTNVLTMVTAPATTDLIMVTYQTHTNMATPAANSEVLAIGDVESHSFHSYMQVLLNSLIGKINTNALSSGAVNHNLRLSTYSIVAGKLETNSYDTPIQHPNINMIAVSSPVVKVFPYLTRSNGKAYLNLVFKEMKYNGTSWGDNNKFNIVDNVSTTTDDNGATVLIGQKKVELPYFIGQGE